MPESYQKNVRTSSHNRVNLYSNQQTQGPPKPLPVTPSQPSSQTSPWPPKPSPATPFTVPSQATAWPPKPLPVTPFTVLFRASDDPPSPSSSQARNYPFPDACSFTAFARRATSSGSPSYRHDPGLRSPSSSYTRGTPVGMFSSTTSSSLSPSRCLTSARRLLPCADTRTQGCRSRSGTIASNQYGSIRSTTSLRHSALGSSSGGRAA